MLSSSARKEFIRLPEVLPIVALFSATLILHESTAKVESIRQTELPVSINVCTMYEASLCDTITFAYIMYPFVIIGIWALRLCTIERKRIHAKNKR